MLSEELTSPARWTEPPSLPQVWRTSSRVRFSVGMSFLFLVFFTATAPVAWESVFSSAKSGGDGTMISLMALTFFLGLLFFVRRLVQPSWGVVILSEKTLTWGRTGDANLEADQLHPKGLASRRRSGRVSVADIRRIGVDEDNFTLELVDGSVLAPLSGVLNKLGRRELGEALPLVSENIEASLVDDSFDAAEMFGDEVAGKTRWCTIAGGANFQTHRLRKGADGIWFPRATMTYLACAGGLIAVGTAILSAFVEMDGWWWSGPEILVAGALIWIGLVLFRSSKPSIEIDLAQEVVTVCARRFRDLTIPGSTGKTETVPFTAFHALQLVRHVNSGSDSSYTSYELSLVLRDGRRAQVIHTGWLPRLQDDARELAELMKLPLWERV